MWIKYGPRLLETPDFFPAYCVKPAASLIDIRKALENKGNEQRNKDVHADDIPRNEESPRPRRTSAVILVMVLSLCAVWWDHGSEIFHELIPPLAAASAEE